MASKFIVLLNQLRYPLPMCEDSCPLCALPIRDMVSIELCEVDGKAVPPRSSYLRIPRSTYEKLKALVNNEDAS